MHIPVLEKKVLEYFNPKTNQNFIDCTLGEGGHSLAILEKTGPKGKILGIDRDSDILENIRIKLKQAKYKKYRNRLILVCDNFINLKEIVKREKFSEISGILFDLGMSSWHLEKSGRGFSFKRKEPLDMRFDLKNQLTAEKILNFYSKSEIEKILREYGEEKFASQIAEKIVEERKLKPIKTTNHLVEIIKRALPKRYLNQKRHFATKTFQALRIAVNDELNNLKKVLPQALDILRPKGKLIVISFHSLEDRIVKNFFREKEREGIIKILTKKPVTPSLTEVKINPRSRSAKLRAAQKL